MALLYHPSQILKFFLREVDPINLLLKSAEKTLESYEKIRKYKDTEKLFK